MWPTHGMLTADEREHLEKMREMMKKTADNRNGTINIAMMLAKLVMSIEDASAESLRMVVDVLVKIVEKLQRSCDNNDLVVEAFFCMMTGNDEGVQNIEDLLKKQVTEEERDDSKESGS